jgi:hypothetical protein
MIDWDSEFPRASRNVFGAVSGRDYDDLFTYCAEARKEFLRARDIYWELVAQERRASERVQMLERAERTARERIRTLEQSERFARERASTLEAAAQQAERDARDEIAGLLAAARQDAERTRERVAVLQAASEARDQRVAHALVDAAAVVDGLDFAIKELAALADPHGGRAENQHLELVLRRLFPRLVAAVSISGAESVSPTMVTALSNAAGGRRTWEADEITEAGERPLDASGALANGVVVLARYEPQTFPDGDIPGLVERVCHALAGSLAARRRAQAQAGDRDRVTLLADGSALERLRVLRESQGCEVALVGVQLGSQLNDTQLGLYGGPAWSATLFDLAGQLDRLARDHGGEAFELEGAICCVVERRHADAVADTARRIAATLDLETEVVVS